jgi:SET domain-containing protein
VILLSLLLLLSPDASRTIDAALANAAAAQPNNKERQRPLLSSTCHALASARLNDILVKPTVDNKGLGAFSTIPIIAGAWVGEYHSEVLTRRQVEARYWKTKKRQVADRRWIKSRKQRNQGLSGDYLFDMGDDIFLDAEDVDVSGWCRFMNHAPSARCNVETRCTRQTWNGNGTASVDPRLWYVALCDIAPGEELLYDYGDSYWDGN